MAPKQDISMCAPKFRFSGRTIFDGDRHGWCTHWWYLFSKLNSKNIIRKIKIKSNVRNRFIKIVFPVPNNNKLPWIKGKSKAGTRNDFFFLPKKLFLEFLILHYFFFEYFFISENKYHHWFSKIRK